MPKARTRRNSTTRAVTHQAPARTAPRCSGAILDAAVGLGQSGELAGALGGAAGEEFIDTLEGHAGGLADGADHGRRLVLEEMGADEAEDGPVILAELI